MEEEKVQKKTNEESFIPNRDHFIIIIDKVYD